MLPAAARLRRRAEFTSAVRGGRRAARGALVLHVLIDQAAPPVPARVGFVVSRAVGPAVLRNQVKRRLRHLVRERLEVLPPGALVVVRALPAAARRSYQALGADLDAALRAALGVADRRHAAGPGVDARAPAARGPMARLISLPIVAYRRWVSPAMPARCRFHPSCSAYALEAIAVHGAARGTGLAIRRLLRCHPFHPGGYDPVPPVARRRANANAPGAAT